MNLSQVTIMSERSRRAQSNCRRNPSKVFRVRVNKEKGPEQSDPFYFALTSNVRQPPFRLLEPLTFVACASSSLRLHCPCVFYTLDAFLALPVPRSSKETREQPKRFLTRTSSRPS